MKPQSQMPQDLWADSSQGALEATSASTAATTPANEDQTREQHAVPTWRDTIRLRDRLQRSLAAPSLAVIAVVVLSLVISVTVVWAKPHEPPESGEAVGFSTQEPGLASNPDSNQGPGASEPPDVVVHVVGEVNDPGIVTLEPGARVLDAIEAAGGARETAALEALNLARIVSDGEQIDVFNQARADEEPANPGISTDNGTQASPGPKVSLNSADEVQLQVLPGVGPALAARIIDWRTTNGPFSTIEQLTNVSGIGEKTFEKMRDQLSL